LAIVSQVEIHAICPLGIRKRNVDISTWLGVAFFLLSIPMGIATNLLTPRLVSYLEKRKLIKSNRTKEQDVTAYRSIEAFKKGTRDKYASYVALAALSVIFTVGGATCALLWALKYNNAGESDLHAAFLPILMAVFFLLSALFLAMIVATARRIERFDEYTAEMRAKWGPNVV
jgi:hypothetical protein